MKKLAFILLFALSSMLLRAQFGCTCLTEGILFMFQDQIDNFQSDYPGCKKIGGDVMIGGIEGSSDISNLDGLNVLTSIGGYLAIGDGYAWGNMYLESLNGLANLTSLDGDLIIGNNLVLTSLSGLESLNSISGNLRIIGNHSLTTCEVQSICDYLASPNGTVSISNNAPGCNSQAEVELACETVGVGQSAVSGQRSAVRIYPNPASSLITVEAEELLTNSTFAIYNLHGQEVLRRRITQETTVLDISHLPSGIYFHRTSTIDHRQSAMRKLVKASVVAQ